jgi:tRNA threonylcarbamoyl adenosine modification protein YeaZ
MKILALEFSSAERSVAIVQGDASGQVLRTDEARDVTPGRGSRPLQTVEEALKLAGVEREQIECIAVGLGPGSYTGIRAAIALAQGWQLACGVKLLGISSAECVAAMAPAQGLTGAFSVVIDAQREEFYLSEWNVEGPHATEISPLRLASRADVEARAKGGAQLVGPEVKRWFPSGLEVCPQASMLGRLGVRRDDFVSADKLEPIYLRAPSFVKAPPPRILP